MFEASQPKRNKKKKKPEESKAVLALEIETLKAAGWLNVTGQILRLKGPLEMTKLGTQFRTVPLEPPKPTKDNPNPSPYNTPWKVLTGLFGDDFFEFLLTVSRLRPFTEVENRLCFTFAFLHLAEDNYSTLESAWNAFNKDLVAEGLELDRKRAYAWRSCLCAVPLEEFHGKMTENILKMIKLGNLLIVDESLFPATFHKSVRFWESVIQLIVRKPHPLGHLLYMGVCALELSELPLAAFFEPYTKNNRPSPCEAFQKILAKRQEASPAHIHAIGDAAFATKAMVDDLQRGISTGRQIADATFSLSSGYDATMQRVFAHDLPDKAYRVFYNTKSGNTVWVFSARDKAGKSHNVFRLSTGYCPVGLDAPVDTGVEQSVLSVEGTQTLLTLPLNDLRVLAAAILGSANREVPTGTAEDLVGQICGINYPVWRHQQQDAPVEAGDELVLIDSEGDSHTCSVSVVSKWKKPEIESLYRK